MRHSVGYILFFSALLCIACALMVSGSAVSLKDLQEVNRALEKKRNVLEAAGLVKTGDKPSAEEIQALFADVEAVLVDIETGREVEGDALAFDQQKAKSDPELGRPAPPNNAGITKMPKQAVVYKLKNDAGETTKLVLPIEGYGLWGTLFGFIAMESDTVTVGGLTYYQHKETAGLGGEVDNPRWKALWPGRKAVDESYEPVIEVIKGPAGPVDEAPHKIDGLSGATITSRGVTNMIQFWLGPEGFGPYLENFREGRSAA